MDLAREQCGGDFDLVSNNDSTWNIGRVVSSSSVMLVHCQHEPPPRAVVLQASTLDGSFSCTPTIQP